MFNKCKFTPNKKKCATCGRCLDKKKLSKMYDDWYCINVTECNEVANANRPEQTATVKVVEGQEEKVSAKASAMGLFGAYMAAK